MRRSRHGGAALVLFTSGTTSRPKLVPLTEANLLASADHVATTLALTPGDRCLGVMPLFHIHGLVAGLLAPLLSGGSVVCTPGFVGVGGLGLDRRPGTDLVHGGAHHPPGHA